MPKSQPLAEIVKLLNTQATIILTSCFAVAGLIVLVINLFPFGIANGITQNLSCVSSIEERIVRGNSLTGIIEPDETVKIFFGYYDCNEIKKNDIVIYNYAGNPDPLIKIVKGVEGDKFAFQKTEAGWYILINEEILKNSKNQPYILDERGYRMLSLYEKDYTGIIPENAYLIMGNLTSGTTDSSRYGLVHKNDILGKAIR